MKWNFGTSGQIHSLAYIVLQVLIYLQSIVYHFISKIENKWKKENLQIDYICDHGKLCAYQSESKGL